MEALTNPIGLRISDFDFAVFDVVDRQVQLIIVSFRSSAILGAAIR